MPYRSDREALLARCEMLETEIGRLRTRERAVDALEDRLRRIERELHAARTRLRRFESDAESSLLDRARVASPCNVAWSEMAGDDRVRHCGRCDKNVYDVSAMTRVEAEALIASREGKLCLRFYRRADGTVLTRDCPDGQRRRRRRVALVVLGSGALSALGVTAYVAHQERVERDEIAAARERLEGNSVEEWPVLQPARLDPGSRPIMGDTTFEPVESHDPRGADSEERAMESARRATEAAERTLRAIERGEGDRAHAHRHSRGAQ